jgi:hypothetical protein
MQNNIKSTPGFSVSHPFLANCILGSDKWAVVRDWRIAASLRLGTHSGQCR